jgi:hypothetical protein
MGVPHVISALRDKRSELSGLIAHLERQIDQHRADLTHVDAVIRLYAPEIEPETIPAKLVRGRNSWFRPGECVRLACDLLRDAPGPLPTSTIITDLIRMKGIPDGDVRAHDLIQRTVLSTLDRARTTIERVMVGGSVCWRIRD